MTTSTTQGGFRASRRPRSPYGVKNTARRTVWCALILTTAWLAPGAATAGTGAGTDLWLQAAKLTPSIDVAQVSLALSDDTAVIGENAASPGGNPFQGAAFVFVRDGDTWTQQAPLVASDGVAGDSFGQSSVALAGDTVLVGAPNAEVNGNPGQGAVYVFTRSGDVWTEQAKLTASDGAASDIFGWSVALSDDTAVVGAFGADVDGAVDQGATYVFTRTGESWNEQAKLTASDGAAGDLLGQSVAVSGDTALIGGSQIAVDGNLFQGAAYVFTRDGGIWDEQAKLVAFDGAASDVFGESVVLSGDTAIVGALGADIDGTVDQGAAYVFTRSGESWDEQAKLTASDGAASAIFGGFVALSGDTALVSAGGAKEFQGAGYVFTRSGEDWSEQAKLTLPDGSAGDELGHPVALAGDTALLGAPGAGEGEIHMFVNRPPGFAALRGTVRSLGRCGAGDAPLSGATVEIVGAESTKTLQTNADGVYQTFLPDIESPLTITVTANDHQPLTVFGIELSGGDTVVQDFDLTLDAPCATAEPKSFSLELPPDQSVTETLTFGNADGAANLAWSITTAAPPGASMAGGVVSCDATEPGIIVHDDGTIENGYSGIPGIEDQVIFADRLVPTFYPASIASLCVAFLSLGPTDLDFELVVFDDDGPDGGPGTELGALPASAAGIPVPTPLPPIPPPVWFGFDLSSLDISIDSGSVFVGARWTTSDPNVFVAADESPGNPVGFADGYWWNSNDSARAPIQDNFAQYRSLFIRAVEGGSGCDEPTTIPWLSVDPTSGSVPPGGSGEVVVSLNTTGLSPGEYQANLCVASNDPLRPLIVVPIYLTVTLGGTPELGFDPSSFDFGEVEVGTPGPSGFLTLLNTGDGEATGLSFSGLPDSGFEANTGSCGDTLPAGGSCMVVVAFNPTEPGPASATLQATSAEGASADLALAGTGIGGGGFTPMALEVDPDPFFSDGNGVFEPGEVVEVAPAWRNDGSAGVSLTGVASAYHGPDGANYVPLLGNADYDLVDTGQTASCLEATGVCYWLGVNDPAARPATHWEASFDETLDDADGTTRTWALHIGDSFTDVPRSSPFYEAVETLLHHGVTGGCTGIEYCPGGVNTRGQMAVFLLKAAEGGDYTPPACVDGEELFDDVPFDSSLCPWIQDLAARGVTSGCGGGNYCPGDPVSRAQMAIFLLKAFEGEGYTPPECTGEFTDVTCPSPFAAWIEELAAGGITGGCAETEYCPATPVTRAQMAVLVTKTFGLTLYGP